MAFTGRNDKTLNTGSTFVSGTFFPQGASAPTKGEGVGWTVGRTSAGLFLLTILNTKTGNVGAQSFSHRFAGRPIANATCQMAAATDIKAEFGTYTAATATTDATIALRTIAVATETDVAANANNSVSFQLEFRDSQITK